MADPLHARDLIVEDALQSRGLVVDDEALIEQERELDEDLKRASGSNDTLSRTNSRSSSKGKGRDDSPDDGGDGAYTFDGDSAYRREASSSSSTLRPQQRPQNGYDTVKDENDGPMPASYPYKVRKAPPGHRQPHPAGTPISTTAFHHPQQQSVYASISPNCAYQSTSNLNHNPHNEEDDPASPFRRPGQGYHRTSDRLIGSILARDPLKELQHADSEHSKSLTKKQVRAAWWRSIFINCLFVLAW